ncbi:Cell differentiation rcd1, partial [Thalictrum thalictroides]
KVTFILHFFLIQSVAAHPDTRQLFLNAHIPLYLYPFLYTTCNSKPFDYLRLTSLGVIGALVKENDADAVSFLLSTEIVPLCLRSMEVGSQLSKNSTSSELAGVNAQCLDEAHRGPGSKALTFNSQMYIAWSMDC